MNTNYLISRILGLKENEVWTRVCSGSVLWDYVTGSQGVGKAAEPPLA